LREKLEWKEGVPKVGGSEMGIFLFPLLKFGPFLFILFIFFSLSLCLAGLGGSVTLTRA